MLRGLRRCTAAQETQAAFGNALRGVFLTPLKTTAFRALVTCARRWMPALLYGNAHMRILCLRANALLLCACTMFNLPYPCGVHWHT